MNISKFKVEFWLNPLDDKAKYNLGSSCCKPVTVKEFLELTNTDSAAFFTEIENMSRDNADLDWIPRHI